MGTELPRILFVDDEPRLLDGLRRQLHGIFDISTTTAPADVIGVLETDPPQVLVSDYAMPGMTGAVLLSHARQVAPDTTRVLLTGQADLTGAIAAVNEGGIFRFLLKPTSFDELVGALNAAVDQHRLVTGERVLLEQTLRGSVQALVETLSLANPVAFARSTRVHQLVVRLLDRLEVDDRWAVEIAALLCQLGAVTLPPEVVEKLASGTALTPRESLVAGEMDAATVQILGSIPRLDDVRDILAGHRVSGADPVPFGARLLRLALDFDALTSSGMAPGDVLHNLHGRDAGGDRELLRALGEVVSDVDDDGVVEIGITGLAPGMILAEDLRTADGVLLMSRGNEVTPSAVVRVRNFGAVASALPDQVRVIVPKHLAR